MSDHPTEKEIPIGLIIAGLAAYGISALMHHGTASVMSTLVAALIVGNVETLLLIAAAYIVAGVLKISFGDFRTASLKFFGASLAAGGIGAIIPGLGIVTGIIFLGLIMWLFELELPYAIALTIVNWVLSWLVAGIILSALL